MRRFLLLLALTLAALPAALTIGSGHSDARPRPKPKGIHKIKHVIVIMQENRSFDQYFGTYPNADGFPRTASGDFAVCVRDPAKGTCEKPFHDTADLNAGGPH